MEVLTNCAEVVGGGEVTYNACSPHSSEREQNMQGSES